MKTTIPGCDCGHPDAYWHGDRAGLRVFECKSCHESKAALACLLSGYVQRNKHRLGALGAQNIDLAVSALREALPGFVSAEKTKGNP